MQVETVYGPVTGFIDTFPLSDKSSASKVLAGENGGSTGVRKWLGIPYAQAGRWRKPTVPESWKESKECLEFGSKFPQPPSSQLLAAKGFERSFLAQSEDSHSLNVFAPDAVGEKLPVLVWIYGGSLNTGHSGTYLYDPTEWIRAARANKFIVVTFNYRLGIFGFFSGPDLLASDGESGNYGMYDAIEALKWVQSNIGAFGGDKDNVTLFGESAGAFMVSALLVSKQKLFTRAIMQSGAPGTMGTRPVETAYPAYSAIISSCGTGAATPAARIAGLRALPWQDLLEAHNQAHSFGGVGLAIEKNGIWTESITATLEKRGCDDWITDVIIGTNQDEGSMFSYLMPGLNNVAGFKQYIAKFSPATQQKYLDRFPAAYFDTLSPTDHLTSPASLVIADQVFLLPANQLIQNLANGKTKVFVYRFKEVIDRLAVPTSPLGSMHAMEIGFVFNSVGALWEAGSHEASTAAQMGSRWAGFATNGVPGRDWKECTKANPTWLVFNPDGMVKNEEFELVV